MEQKTKYFENHPELKNLIADYVQALLFGKNHLKNEIKNLFFLIKKNLI